MYEEVEINSKKWLDLNILKNEEFRDIPEYEGLYQVSNYGRVKRNIFKNNKYCIKKEKILRCLKQQQKENSYLKITLTKNGKQQMFYIHKLVACVFLDNPNEYKEVNHKNENKYDNKVSNLEYCSRIYNMNYGTILKRKSLAMKKYLKEKNKKQNFLEGKM